MIFFNLSIFIVLANRDRLNTPQANYLNDELI